MQQHESNCITPSEYTRELNKNLYQIQQISNVICIKFILYVNFFGNVPKATIQIVIVCLILIEEGKDDGYDSE